MVFFTFEKCFFTECMYVFMCIQAVAATLQAGASWGGPGAGQGEDAGGQEV